jgi:hypothetical protein
VEGKLRNFEILTVFKQTSIFYLTSKARDYLYIFLTLMWLLKSALALKWITINDEFKNNINFGRIKGEQKNSS